MKAFFRKSILLEVSPYSLPKRGTWQPRSSKNPFGKCRISIMIFSTGCFLNRQSNHFNCFLFHNFCFCVAQGLSQSRLGSVYTDLNVPKHSNGPLDIIKVNENTLVGAPVKIISSETDSTEAYPFFPVCLVY